MQISFFISFFLDFNKPKTPQSYTTQKAHKCIEEKDRDECQNHIDIDIAV